MGHGFAYGVDVGGFIGADSFAFSDGNYEGIGEGKAIAQWFFQWAFAGACRNSAESAVRISGVDSESPLLWTLFCFGRTETLHLRLPVV